MIEREANEMSFASDSDVKEPKLPEGVTMISPNHHGAASLSSASNCCAGSGIHARRKQAAQQ